MRAYAPLCATVALFALSVAGWAYGGVPGPVPILLGIILVCMLAVPGSVGILTAWLLKHARYEPALGLVAACMLLLPATAAYAQDIAAAVPDAAPWWVAYLWTLWMIIEPIVTVIVATVGPVLGTIVAAKVVGYLNLKSEAERQKAEAELRAAIHQSAVNGLKVAATRIGLPPAGTPVHTSPAVLEGVGYVKLLNPGDVEKAKLTDSDIAEIVASKVPEVRALVAAGVPAGAARAT